MIPILLTAVALAAPTHRLAIVAGANEGGDDRATLQYADDDARQVAAVLLELGGGAPDDIDLLLSPTASELRAALARLREKVQTTNALGRRTEVVVYYSGHSDETGLLLGDDRFEFKDFKASLLAVPADVRIAIVDACSSGALVQTKGGVHQPGFLLDQANDVSGNAFVTSSSANEVAQESEQVEGSFFTHFLVSGLRGAADDDGDGQVTLSEAYRFAFDETLSRTERTLGGAQHASYAFHLSGSGDIVLTDIRDTSASLVLDEDMAGRLFVRDQRGRLAAELTKEKGKPIVLGLPPDRYRLTLDRDGLLYGAEVELHQGVSDLGAVAFSALVPEDTAWRGGSTKALQNTTPAAEKRLRNALFLTSGGLLAVAGGSAILAGNAKGRFQEAQTTEDLVHAQRQANTLFGVMAGAGVTGIASGVAGVLVVAF